MQASGYVYFACAVLVLHWSSSSPFTHAYEQADGVQSAENGDKPIHVVMTTFKADPTKDQSDRMQIERNTAHTWSHLHPRVKLIMMCYKGEKKEEEQANGEECERDAEGTPLLRTFYHRAFNQYPDAKTYTFINGDIISDRSFLATADAVAMAAQKGHLKKRFLVVGKRTNVEWKKQRVKDVKDSAFNFLNALNAGKKFISIAEDYFMISKDTFRFNDEIPPFVIGRPAYDNWLVHYANLHYYIDSVDATKTVPAIHMTDSEGNSAWGGKGVHDLGINKLITHGTGYALGRTSMTTYYLRVKDHDFYREAPQEGGRMRFDFKKGKKMQWNEAPSFSVDVEVEPLTTQ